MRVLIVEDDAKTRATLQAQLRDEGLAPVAVESGEAALAEIERGTPDLLLVDIRLPSMSGVDLVRQLASENRLPPTIILSGEATIAETVAALQLGVYDFLEKPFHRERLLRSVRNALEHKQLRSQVAQLSDQLVRSQEIVGQSKAIEQLRSMIAKLAPTDANILIMGESGTGKELVAEAIHRQSARAKCPLVKINCAAIPAQLMESELFGHARGAFTDARTNKAGLFEAAHGGTLFLDEIGEMNRELQAGLLRVLEDGRVRRLGENQERSVDVRVVTATNKDLSEAVSTGEFRGDLYFRVANIPIQVPSLRDRGEDVRVLLHHFMKSYARRYDHEVFDIVPAVLDALDRHSWPGNVRELKNLCERLVILGSNPITLDQLPTLTEGESLTKYRPRETVSLREFRSEAEANYIRRVLTETGWNVTTSARRLGLRRSYLHQKMANLGIQRPPTEV